MVIAFVIPGIVKAYEYMMIPYLLADNPQMTKEQAFAESKRMMQGQKWKAFVWICPLSDGTFYPD